jgi:hypothetical protein
VAFKLPERGKVVGYEDMEVSGITYKRVIREAVEPEEQSVYVKNHVIDTNLGYWMVGISFAEAPVSEKSLAYKTWFVVPLGSVYDFRVIATNHQPLNYEE